MGFLKQIIAKANASPATRSLLEGAANMAREVKLSIDNLETSAVNEVLDKAKAGDAEAQFDCGEMYSLGTSLPQDDAEAAGWFRKAADQNHKRAQLFLATLCALGRGVSKDIVEAYKWARIATAGDNAEASKTLRRLASRMSSEQVALGEQRAHEFAETRRLEEVPVDKLKSESSQPKSLNSKKPNSTSGIQE